MTGFQIGFDLFTHRNSIHKRSIDLTDYELDIFVMNYFQRFFAVFGF